MYDKIIESVKFLNNKINFKPDFGIILGSGLGALADKVENKIEIDYKDIPNFPISTVKGHAGKLIFGNIGNKKVVVMQGRFHFYEGYSMKEVTYPVYIMKMLGVTKLIVSNAAGGINKDFEPGTLMIIKDHINFFGTNPLIGKNDESFGTRFPDMSEIYSHKFVEHIKNIASEKNIKLKEGIYLGVTGPSFETSAEIKMYSILGADAVGMSTVPETIVANYLGLEILGISCITNMATGISKTHHSHESVIETAKKTEAKFCDLVENVIKKYNY